MLFDLEFNQLIRNINIQSIYNKSNNNRNNIFFM